MKKAVFFDIDGTLWDQKMQVPNSAVAAIQKLRQNGNYAFICSGRSRAAIQAKELLEDIGFDGILAGCGTYIEHEGNVIYEKTLTQEELEGLFLVFGKSNSPVVLEGKQYLYADFDRFHDNAYILLLRKALGEGFQPLAAHAGNYDANKLTAYIPKDCARDLECELSEKYELLFHTPEIIELVPKGFSKASGIQWICGHLNIDHKDTYAFGDSINDLEMLQYVRHGIAMGNATDAAKAAADYVTADLHEDGIEKGLRHFGLI